MTVSGVEVHALSPGELAAVDGLLDELMAAYSSPEAPGFLADARRIAFSRLPGELVRSLSRFHDLESSAAVALSGLTVDDRRIGPTPQHWGAQTDRRSTLREELYLVLLASLLGDPFGWATLQDGRLVANVLPIRDQEEAQSGHGSLAALAWHTEDAFHPFRPDYLGLMALRNDGATPTTFASVDALRLTTRERYVLAQPRFLIRADDEHVGQRARDMYAAEVDGWIPSDWTAPAPTAVLFGSRELPYLRIDPYFMAARPGDAEAAAALATAIAQLDDALEDLVLEPGTVCFLDNYRAVHGRRAYQPAYDGRDRWLKKVVVARDLRRSRAARGRTEGRVLAPTVLSDAWAGAGA